MSYRFEPKFPRPRSAFLVAALLVAVSCNLQEPTVVDPLDPEPPTAADSIAIAPEVQAVPVGESVTYHVPDTTVLGNPVDGAVEWTVNGSAGTIDANGVFLATEPGAYTVQATRSGRRGRIRGTVTAGAASIVALRLTPGSVNVSPGAAFTFGVTGVLADSTSVPVSVTWTATGGTINAGTYRAGASAGTFRVIATQTDGTLADTSTVVVTLAAPTLQAIELTPGSVSLASGGSQQFAAVGRMSNGSTSSVVVNWAATGGTISSSGAYTAGGTSGTFRVVATQQGGTLADTASITITPAAPTLQAIEVSPASVTIESGASQQFSAVGRMSNGTTTTVAVTWTATGGTMTSDGDYAAGTVDGTFRVIARQLGGTRADTATVTVSTSAPTVTLQAVEVSPTSATLPPGDVQQFSAIGRMSDGSTSTVSVNWSATGGVVSASGAYIAGETPGTYRVIGVQQGGTRADTAAIVITVPPPTLQTVSLTPPSVTLAPGDMQQFSVVGQMSDGSTASVSVNYSATGGTVNTAGTYTAGGSAGTFRVIATQQGGTRADTSSVTITAPAPTLTAIELTPGSVLLEAGATQQFSAVGRMSDNSTAGVAVTYTATGGTVSAGGLYTAGSTAGTYRVIATQQGGTRADTSAITITLPAPTLTRVEVTPATASLAAGAAQQFSAVGRMSDNSTQAVSVTWSATGGTITAGGLYTAGSTAGTSYRVIAVRQGDTRADTATVTITAAAATLTAIEVTPATVSVAAGATQPFTAVGRMSDNGTQAVTVTWSATGGTITTAGVYTAGSTAGTYRVIAVQQGDTKADTSTVTVTAPPPPPPPLGATADPTLLPVAAGQMPNTAAYAALGVPGRPAGWSYTDPTTGVRVWKVSSASVPAANSTVAHDYSEGGQEVSLPWGPNGDRYTIKASLTNGSHWLVDFQVGVGFSNWRRPVRGPSSDLCWSFSNNPATPQVAYVMSGGTLYRINTATNTQMDGGGFPHADAFHAPAWLSVDRNDAWFTWMTTGNNQAVAWNAQTGVRRVSPSSINVNEIRLPADGGWALLAGEPSYWWRLSDGLVSSNAVTPRPVHLATLRGGLGVTMNVDDAIPPDVYRLQAGTTGSATNVSTAGFAGYAYHGSGNWIQSDADLGGDLTRQWALFASYGLGPSYPSFPVNDPQHKLQNAMGYVRANGSDMRLLAHAYSPYNGQYWQIPLAKSSPDGRLVLFNSNMQLSGRGDLFLAEVPAR